MNCLLLDVISVNLFACPVFGAAVQAELQAPPRLPLGEAPRARAGSPSAAPPGHRNAKIPSGHVVDTASSRLPALVLGAIEQSRCEVASRARGCAEDE